MTNEALAQLNSLCVFCGSSPGTDPRYRAAAQSLGRILGEQGITLVFGGGNIGLMGVLAGAAQAAGGKVIGVIPEHLLGVEVPPGSISELIVVDSMHTRKRRMFDLSDAFCVLPGGLGTLDEAFEILTWKQLRLHNKPVVIANIGGFWRPWLGLLEALVSGGFAEEGALRLFSMVETIDQVVPSARRDLAPPAVGESRLF